MFLPHCLHAKLRNDMHLVLLVKEFHHEWVDHNMHTGYSLEPIPEKWREIHLLLKK